MSTVLVTGASRGLGLEFARQYAADGWRVIACCRDPDAAAGLRGVAGDVRVERLDVRDAARAAALAAKIGREPIDVLLNNAGVYGPDRMHLGRLDYAAWADVLAVNTLAPVRLAELLVENVAAGGRKVMAFVSSTMGSVASNEEGRHYPYRSSKAALNACVKSLAIDLRDRGVTAVALCPGWVQTDMGGPAATLTPAESVAGVRGVLARLTPADSGRFLSYDGGDIPW